MDHKDLDQFKSYESELISTFFPHAVVGNINVNSYNIHFITAGEGSTVVLLHGANIGLGQWYKNIEFLSKKFQVVAVDFPGSGGSSKIDFSTSDIERDFIDPLYFFLKQLNISNPFIIAHSFSAWAIAKVIEKYDYKVKKIVFVNPMGLTRKIPGRNKLISLKPIAVFLSRRLMRPNKKNLKSFLESAMKEKEGLNNVFLNYYTQSVNRKKVTHPLMFMNRLSFFFRVRKEINLIDFIYNTNIPYLLIFGISDPLIPFKKVITELNLSKAVIFEDSGHVPFIEESGKFNKTVLNFLEKD